MNSLLLYFLGLFGLITTTRFFLVQPLPAVPFFVLFALSAAVFIAAIHRARSGPPAHWLLAGGSAFLLRAVLLNDIPVLSNDVFRYLWDGALVLSGRNPAAFAPNDPSLMEFSRLVSMPPDHRDVASVYPPITQAYFALLTWLHASPSIFGFGAAILDSFSVLLLYRALKLRGLSPNGALILAWHPLAILESGHSGHLDSLGIFFVTLYLVGASTQSPRRWIGVAGASLVKLWPFGLFALARQGVRSRMWWVSTLGSAAICLLLFGSHFSGLERYFQTWEFHSAFYSLLRLILSPAHSRIVLAAIFLLFVADLVRRVTRGWLAEEDAAFQFTAAFLLFSPTVHPWYALWLLPFLSIRNRPGWLTFTLLIVSAYVVLPDYQTGLGWHESVWPRVVTYFPLVGIGMWKWFQTKGNS